MAETASQNGHRASNGKVRVAIVGVGNCASSFVQGVQYYQNAKVGETVPGLMHVDLGGYHIWTSSSAPRSTSTPTRSARICREAIFSGQNNTVKFSDVPKLDVPVYRGMTHDGIGKYLSQVITKASGETADVVKILQDTKTDVVVSYLPVGSEEATKWYVEQVLAAGCGFVNCIPVFIAREPYWRRRFEEKGLPIVGDDIKSQVGATIVHRKLARLFQERGVQLERTHQLNVGGNTDFLNMLERERLESKKISKTNAVTSQLDYDLGAKNVHIGPSDSRRLAGGSEVGLHPARGPRLRRRAPEHRAQARGGRLPQLGGHRDRRRPLCQAGARQRHRRRARVAVRLLHEVAAGAAPRRRVPHAGRDLHREVHAKEVGHQGEGRGQAVRTAWPMS